MRRKGKISPLPLNGAIVYILFNFQLTCVPYKTNEKTPFYKRPRDASRGHSSIAVEITLIFFLTIMWYWFFGLFFSAMALLGNALIILLIIFKPSLRTSTNCLIVSLAVSDFFAVLSYFPVMCISNFFHKIDLSHAGIWYKVCFTFIYCSTTNLCVLAADRYLAVVKPLKYATFTSSKTSRQNILILTGWITPLIFFTLPALFSYQGNDVFTLVFEANRILTFQVYPCIFFLLVIFRLLCIVREMRRQEIILTHQLSYNRAIYSQSPTTCCNQPSRPESRTSMMIILLLIFFNITFAGGNYICYCFVLKTCVVHPVVKKIIYLLYIINLAVNPIVYAFFKKDIRRATLQLMNRKIKTINRRTTPWKLLIF